MYVYMYVYASIHMWELISHSLAAQNQNQLSSRNMRDFQVFYAQGIEK